MATPVGGKGHATPEEVKRRFCELVALGLTQKEAAGAVGIALKTGERILRIPEYRAIVDKAKAKQHDLAGMAVDVIEDGLTAEFKGGDNKGEPNHLARMKAAEAYLKHFEAIKQIEGGDLDYDDIEGVIHIMPSRDGTSIGDTPDPEE